MRYVRLDVSYSYVEYTQNHVRVTYHLLFRDNISIVILSIFYALFIQRIINTITEKFLLKPKGAFKMYFSI